MSGIEEVLNLPKLSDALKKLEQTDESDEEVLVIKETSENEYAAAMQTAVDYERLQASSDELALVEHEKEMDKIADVAYQHHETFMELCANVDPRQAEAFVTGATQMLTISFNAKSAKMDKMLRMKKYLLDKERLEMQRGNQEGVIEGETLLADRNDLLDRILDKK